ncbi:MAG: hypothetical protein SGJ20_15535, partial [Planctomycetota bacterium]|nr:hypothetical protein [Planctomycetota bacterium]
FELPKKAGETTAEQTASFLSGGMLVISDNVVEVEKILKAITANRADNLASVPAYKESMARCQKATEAGKVPHVRWFLEPFGYIEAMRVIDPPTHKREGPDLVKALRKQGFTAIQGLGGFVTFSANTHQTLHRTMIYAPPVPKAKERYLLAANVLEFPNSKSLQAEAWVPPDVATYSTVNWNAKRAFPYLGPLVDEVTGQPYLFEDIIDSTKNDPNGPQLDIEKELVANLGSRVTIVTDFVDPITPKSDRSLYAIETANEKAVAAAVEKGMKHDKGVKRRDVEGFTVWEVTSQEVEVMELTIEVDGGEVQHADLEIEEEVLFQPGKGKTRKKRASRRPGQRAMANSAICVAHGQLFVASNIDMLEKVLKHANAAVAKGSLDATPEYTAVQKEMTALGATDVAARMFSRTEKEFRVTYELLKTNEMPKSQSLLGNLLNSALGDGKPGTIRKAKLDGRQLPAFDAVSKYLGPAGTFIVSEDNGWFVTGFVLKK